MKALAVDKYIAVFRNRLLAFNEYRMDIFGKLLALPVTLIVTILFWSIVFSFQQTIGGFSLVEMTVYACIVAFFRRFNAQGAAKEVEEDINSGKIIVVLCRPIEYFWSEFSSRLAKNLLLAAFIFPFAVITIIFLFGAAKISWLGLLLAAVLLLFSFFISQSLFFAIGAISFWTERSWGFKWVYNFIEQFFSGMFFPVTLFPVLVQKTIFFLPFQHMLFAPTMLAMGKFGVSDFFNSLAILLVWCFVAFALHKTIWHFGLKKFDAKG